MVAAVAFAFLPTIAWEKAKAKPSPSGNLDPWQWVVQQATYPGVGSSLVIDDSTFWGEQTTQGLLPLVRPGMWSRGKRPIVTAKRQASPNPRRVRTVVPPVNIRQQKVLPGSTCLCLQHASFRGC